MYAYAAEAQPASPTHGGTAYIQPLAAIRLREKEKFKKQKNKARRKNEQITTISGCFKVRVI